MALERRGDRLVTRRLAQSFATFFAVWLMAGLAIAAFSPGDAHAVSYRKQKQKARPSKIGPDIGHFVYVSPSGKGKVYIWNHQGAKWRKYQFPPYTIDRQDPVWAADGESFFIGAFLKVKGKKAKKSHEAKYILQVGRDGGLVNARELDASWFHPSCDGETLYYTTHNALNILNLADEDKVFLSRMADDESYLAAFYSRHYPFFEHEKGKFATFVHDGRLVVKDKDKSEMTWVTDDPSAITNLAASPYGRYLTFREDQELRIYDLKEKKLTSFPSKGPQPDALKWAYDNKKLLLLHGRKTHYDGFSIATWPRWKETIPDLEGRSVSWAGWAQGGEWVFYVSPSEDGSRWEFFRYHEDTGKSEKLYETFQSRISQFFNLSRDGRYFLYLGRDVVPSFIGPRRYTLWVFDTETRDVAQYRHVFTSGGSFAWWKGGCQ